MPVSYTHLDVYKRQAYPNVNVVREMTDMMVATRAYEANLMVVESAKEIWGSAIDVLRS